MDVHIIHDLIKTIAQSLEDADLYLKMGSHLVDDIFIDIVQCPGIEHIDGDILRPFEILV